MSVFRALLIDAFFEWVSFMLYYIVKLFRYVPVLLLLMFNKLDALGICGPLPLWGNFQGLDLDLGLSLGRGLDQDQDLGLGQGRDPVPKVAADQGPEVVEGPRLEILEIPFM